ncbi:MAG: enoyl-CoA hydratase/isomerase family protein [Pseudomonadales bacterium]|jgi:enoyl-CoA hydratase/carnithine racemase|nr:enoyl-CoA hydratase/isomerase family protein [Pseudomonadales bacterium]MCP5333590.1 enoyl-CoA hydratase/isomerase family protein [Pseudomonadales bacterium]
MAMNTLCDLQLDGPIATLSLNRPETHNRLPAAELPHLLELLDRVEADARLRVLVLTAAGNKTFCAGFDISDIGSEPQSAVTLDDVVSRLAALSIPTVCALNGAVYGGGVDLSLGCDFRIGVEGMQLQIPAARLGVHYYPNGMRRLIELLGLGMARRLLLLAQRLTAEELLACGYLDQLVPLADLPLTTAQMAQRLTEHAPLAVRGMKSCLNQLARGLFDEARARQGMEAAMNSQDLREGARAFQEKRSPRFKGR